VSKRPDIDPEVVSLIRRWATAEDLSAAVGVLAAGCRGLDPQHRVQLQSEVAEISAEALVELIALEEGLEEGEGEVQELLGLPMLPRQLDRISAWLHDQTETGGALGFDKETWGKLLVGGMERYIAHAAGAAPADSRRAASLDVARKLVGAEDGAFENRPELGTSERAGLRGVLGARSFQKQGRKK